MQLPIQILVCLRLLLKRNGIKHLKNLFWRHVDTIFEKMVAILSKFTVLCLSSYFAVYFLRLRLILFYNKVIYYYIRIFLILLPHPLMHINVQKYIYCVHTLTQMSPKIITSKNKFIYCIHTYINEPKHVARIKVTVL